MPLAIHAGITIPNSLSESTRFFMIRNVESE